MIVMDFKRGDRVEITLSGYKHKFVLYFWELQENKENPTAYFSVGWFTPENQNKGIAYELRSFKVREIIHIQKLVDEGKETDSGV